MDNVFLGTSHGNPEAIGFAIRPFVGFEDGFLVVGCLVAEAALVLIRRANTGTLDAGREAKGGGLLIYGVDVTALFDEHDRVRKIVPHHVKGFDKHPLGHVISWDKTLEFP